MTEFASLLRGGESEQTAVVPGDSGASHLIEEITPVDGKAAMPRVGSPLSVEQIELIRLWIDQGAVDDSPLKTRPYSIDNPPTYSLPPVITSIDFSPDGKLLVVNGSHEVLLFETSTWKPVNRFVGMSQRVESVRFSPDGTRVAVAGGDPGLQGEIQVWEVATGKLLLSKIVSFDTLFGASWSPDGRWIAFGATDNVVRAIDSDSGEQRLYQGVHEDWPRATTFTVTGGYVISGGRDMTVKLTDVPTERFIDNITSITPDALKGGVNSIARNPYRDEILVGGSDGVPKLYRVFRQTARVIGDDANLLHRLGEMKGRIFAVAMSADAGRLAAVSTLDEKSQLKLWSYDTSENIPSEIRAIQNKSPQTWSEDERKLIEAFTPQAPSEIAAWDIERTAVYSLAFDHQGRIAIGTSDGRVEVYDVGQEHPVVSFDVVPVQLESQVASGEQIHESRTAFYLAKSREPRRSANQPPLNVDADIIWERMEVSPTSIELHRWNDYAQLRVTAFDVAGNAHDVSSLSDYFSPEELVWTDASGLVESRQVGQGSLLARFNGLRAEIPVVVYSVAIDNVDFVRDVNPALSRLGCNAGTCHGAQAGKRGFKLSLRGYDAIFDHRSLTDDLAGRRINVSVPADSLMISKPLGIVPHEGGVLMQRGDRYATIIEQWIRQGAKLNHTTPRVTHIEIEPKDPVIQLPGSNFQMRVLATYSDGTKRDVTREAHLESGNPDVATVAPGANIVAVRRGEAPINARFEGSYAATTFTVIGDRRGFEWVAPPMWTKIDELVAQKWQRMKIRPSDLCSDETFVRRVSLDLTGLPPDASVIRAFLEDSRPSREKREQLIDQLLSSDDYVDHWTNKWSDFLQVNSKFLASEGAVALRDWIRNHVRNNTPHDEFVRQIVAAKGSNRENPAAAYYKILRTPEEIVENTTHLFLAVRFNCNKCHDHPFERWTQDQYYETAAYFSQVGLKKDEASGDRTIGGTAVEGAKPLFEEVVDTGNGEVRHQRTQQVSLPKFPFECQFDAPEDASRRELFAAWLTSKQNPYFARSYVNRLWGYLLGTGLIEPLDDIRAGNPPTNPELLEHLEKEFIDSGFDTKHILRSICRSRVYQLSIATNPWNQDDHLNYSHAQARRLPAEVLYDAVHRVTGTASRIPGMPEGARAASFADADVPLADSFLNRFGRPARESACECERSSELRLGSIMALVSGPTISDAIASEGNELHRVLATINDDNELIRELYLRILSRLPSSDEIQAARVGFERIRSDHELVLQGLAEHEAWWAEERIRREAERERLLAETKEALDQRMATIRDERERLEEERRQRIADAESRRDNYRAEQPQKFESFLQEKMQTTSWLSLVPKELSSSNGAQLQALPDRSIRVDGSREKTTYSITFPASMHRLSGLRLEALPAPEVPGQGPGFPGNGNFVVTEIELFVGPNEAELTKLKLKDGKTDFDQAGFSAAAAIDGNNQDQGGWAVHPAGGIEHWAVFALENAVDLTNDGIVRVLLHQYHDAAEHRLARFRISFTMQDGDIPLGLSENLSYLARTPAEIRDKLLVELGLTYFRKTDPEGTKVESEVAVAHRPVPEDEQIVAIRKRIERLSVPTPDDPKLVQLRKDSEQSTKQLANDRVTVVEDLTWALINSPAFLFNY